MYPASPRKKALCIGVSYKGQKGPYGLSANEFELLGAHNDVRKIHNLLTEKYGYENGQIKVLLDADGYMSPTRDNIIAALKDLVAGAEAGDFLFLFFAGHGDQITNVDGKEDDGKDEIILPIDWELNINLPKEDRHRYPHSRIIIDDDMNKILVKNLPPGCRLTGLFDSCHSGTILDLPYERSYGPRSMSPQYKSPIFTEAPRSESPTLHAETMLYNDTLEEEGVPIGSVPQSPVERAHINRLTRRGPLELTYVLAHISRGRMHPNWRKGTWLLRGETRDDKVEPSSNQAQAISWSSCSDGQNGYELKSKHENRSGGIMVKAFVDILNEKPYRTYRDILECLGERLRATCQKINKNYNEANWIMQEPQLGSQQKPNLDNLFAP